MDKAPDAFRTISEVADEIDVPQHVLRFWESRFSQIRPMKRGGGRRYYRPDDVDLLRGVRHLLYGEGYTIRGVQRILREEGAAFVQNVWRVGAAQPLPEADPDREGAVEEDAASSLALFDVARSRQREQDDDERREPILPGPQSLRSDRPIGLSGEDRLRLKSALDELVECRRLIEAGFAREEIAR